MDPLTLLSQSGLFLFEIIIVSLQPFFLEIFMSDGRNSSFMPYIVGREIAGLIMDNMDTELLYFPTCCLKTHKTALHVQHPTNARNFIQHVRIHFFYIICWLNTRKYYTYNILHETHIHIRACARRTSLCIFSISNSHDVSLNFFRFFHRFYSFFAIISLSLNCFPFFL